MLSFERQHIEYMHDGNINMNMDRERGHRVGPFKPNATNMYRVGKGPGSLHHYASGWVSSSVSPSQNANAEEKTTEPIKYL